MKKNLEIWLTDGIFGSKVKKIADAKTAKEAMNKIQDWKKQNANKKAYKIEPYDRIIFDKNCVAIDFGSWCTFMQIDGLTKTDMEEFA